MVASVQRSRPEQSAPSHDHGASGNASLASLLSGAAASSITWGSDVVPAFQLALNTLNAEYLLVRCIHNESDAHKRIDDVSTSSLDRHNKTNANDKKPLVAGQS